jgi:hypothetical protein
MSEIKMKILVPEISDISEIEIPDNDSGMSKLIGDSSVTPSTAIPTSDQCGVYGKHEIKVIDSTLVNTFVKLSEFADPLGRKMVFTVDWDYLGRLWNHSHVYLKDILLETLFSLSLQESIANPNEDTLSIMDDKLHVEDKLGQMVNNHNVLLHLINQSFEVDSNEAEKICDDFFSNPATRVKAEDELDNGWDQRNNILETMSSKTSYE